MDAMVSLDKVEEILRNETSIIAPEDVSLLLVVMYEAAGLPVPDRLIEETNENQRDSE